MRIEPLISPDSFVGLNGLTHLCTGGEGPWLKVQQKVSEEFARLKSLGQEGRKKIFSRGEHCRNQMGELWGVSAKRIGFLPSSSEGINWLVRGLEWREGDNVVTTNLEFPSVAYAMKNLWKQGVEVRLVSHKNWDISEADLEEAIDSRTRLIALSLVSFYTGQCLDLEKLSRVARLKGALLVVDATHASGVVKVEAGLTDLTVSSSYKWMLATHGVAPCYLSNRAETQTETTSFGWHNLVAWPNINYPILGLGQQGQWNPEIEEQPMPERLEPGNPAMLVIMHLDCALNVLLKVGVDRIEKHARELAEHVSIGLEDLGLEVISPKSQKARSGNTCFLAEDAGRIERRLGEKKVLCWGELGRVRISTHLYNGSSDVEHFLKVLAEII